MSGGGARGWTFSGTCSSRSGRQGAVPDRLWEAPFTCRGRGAPECGGAQMWRRRPRPVRPDLGGPQTASLSGHAGAREVPGYGNRHFRAPPWDLAPHAGQARSGSGGGGRGSRCQRLRPRVLEFQVQGTLRGQRHDARQAPNPLLSSLPVLLEAVRAVLGSQCSHLLQEDRAPALLRCGGHSPVGEAHGE